MKTFSNDFQLISIFTLLRYEDLTQCSDDRICEIVENDFRCSSNEYADESLAIYEWIRIYSMRVTNAATDQQMNQMLTNSSAI